MKSFAVFAAVLAVAAAASYNPISTWTLEEINAALKDPATNPDQLPYLIHGLDALMASLYSGASPSVHVVISMPHKETVTLDELLAVIHDPNVHPAVVPYYEQALGELMVAMNNGQTEDSILLSIPAMNVNIWTVDHLSAAIEDPETNPELLVYLEHALNQYMSDLFAGNTPSIAIPVATPPGVITGQPEPVVPDTAVELPQPELEKPVAPEPVKPEAVAEKPVTAAPVAAPLVQLIVNVNANQAPAAPKPTPVVDEVAPIAVNPVMPGPVIAVNPAGWNPQA